MEFPLSYLGDNLSPRGSHNAPWSDPPPPPPPRTRQADGQGCPPEFAEFGLDPLQVSVQ